jgi:hypothetical protein
MPPGVQDVRVVTGAFVNGSCTLRFQNNNSAAKQKVVGASVGPTSPVANACRCTLLKNGIQTLDSSPFAGFGAAATGETDLLPSEFIDAVFTGGPTTGTAQITIHYEEWPL